MPVDYPPLTALGRLFTAPPQAVAPEHSAVSPRATLSIGRPLDELFRLIDDDYRQLPLLAPIAVQHAAIALALASHHFLPFLEPLPALHQLHGLMRGQVLANTSRDYTFPLRSSRDHFDAAQRHWVALRDRLVTPPSSPLELHFVQRGLADLSVYLAFAVHVNVPLLLRAEPTPIRPFDGDSA